jgi:hypothetical protein
MEAIKMPKVYQGYLECDFVLNVERFIVKENSISFELNGSDELRKFEVSGEAKLENSNKCYITQDLELDYQGHASDNIVKIVISSLIESENQCKIKGIWTQNGYDFEFNGNLKKWSQKS